MLEVILSDILLMSATPTCVQANGGKKRKAIILKQLNYELTWYGISYSGT